jgi:hypothetical protein
MYHLKRLDHAQERLPNTEDTRGVVRVSASLEKVRERALLRELEYEGVGADPVLRQAVKAAEAAKDVVRLGAQRCVRLPFLIVCLLEGLRICLEDDLARRLRRSQSVSCTGRQLGVKQNAAEVIGMRRKGWHRT